ncbi:MAG: ATP-binding protein [Bacteroidales bacterium]
MASKLSEEILHFLIDNSDSMISIINSELKYEKVNDSFCRNFSKNREELTGKSPSEIWGGKIYREKIQPNIERSLKGEKVQYRSFFDISGTGGRFYEVTYKPFKSSNTKLNYTIVETRSLGDDKAGDQGAGEKEQKNRFLGKQLPFGIFACTRDGLITEANETFYNILELERKSGLQVRFSDFTSKDYRFFEHIRSDEAGETATFSRVQMFTAGSKEIFTRVSSFVREDTGCGHIIEGTLEDITREVILERRLSRAQRIETLGTLAGGIAHDFNTILTTISGYSEMTMEEAGKGSPVYDYMSSQIKAVRKAGDIINQMLLFSKQHDLHYVPVEPVKVLEEAVDFIISSLPDGISLKKDYREFEGLVHGDPTQLFRVFMNIMTNAIQAMETKGGVLSVGLSCPCSGGDRYVDIVFGDTGTGINPAVIDRIFEPFFTTREVDKGTGMGLAVSYGIVNAMEGEINVESREGEGSVFTVRIPLYDEQEGELRKGDRDLENKQGGPG